MLAIKSMFWIFVLIAALAAVGIFVAKSQEPTQQQEQTEQKPNDTQQDPSPSADKNEQEQTQGWAKYKQGIAYYWKRFFEFSERWHDAIIAIGTAFIAAFTGLLFVATILLWWGGERSSYRQLRAYVSVTANYVYAFGPQTPSQIRFAMTNHGQTPAYKTSSSAAVDILPFPLPKGSNFPLIQIPLPVPSCCTHKLVSRVTLLQSELLRALRLLMPSPITGNEFTYMGRSNMKTWPETRGLPIFAIR
jgi:hypothetical protein